MHLTEWLTRVDADTVLYRFTVADPETWTKPWTAEMPLRVSPARLYEHACHEGNYTLPLASVRVDRLEERPAPGQPLW